LIPLIGNSLSSETGTAMLVGDAKQAIYRWRGGKAEQFIDLFNDENPFPIEKKVNNLPINYRSFKEIVNFNNAFFNYLSTQAFKKTEYRKLYEKAFQETHLEQQGYVNFDFLDFEKDDDRDTLYSEKILETIETCVNNGFSLGDICVLVRKKKEGVAIANYLSQQNIRIVSSETLLINN